MAMTEPVGQNGHNNLGFKVAGDLGELEIIEESSEDEVDFAKEAINVDSLATIPGNLINTSQVRELSNIIVKDSENVQFGNNTYFNGPVIIKQVIQSSNGVANESYVSENNENEKTQYVEPKDNSKKPTFKTWHKISVTAFGVVVLAGICAVIVVTQKDSSNRSPLDSQVETDLPINCILVAGLWLGNCQTILLAVFLLIVPVTLLCINYCFLHNCNETFVERRSRNVQYSSAGGNQVVKQDLVRIVERNEWLAQPIVAPLDPLVLPAPWVIITHTATENCLSQSDCVFRVRIIQSFHVESKKFFDIGYNFLVGGDGAVYVGRGWDAQGAHTKGYNKYSIGIALIGTFSVENPTKYQINALKKLIALGVEKGKIAKDYKLFPHSAFMSTLSPGKTVTDIISRWPHYVNESEYNDVSKLLPNY